MIEKLKSGIYKLTNKFNRKVYIGQSINVDGRYKQHCRSKNANKYTCSMVDIIKQYGIDNFDYDVLIRCPKENLDYWEKFYIRYYCSNNPEFGYNKTSGGKSGFSVVKSTKDKLSTSHKGKTTWNKGIPLLYDNNPIKGYKWMTNGEKSRIVKPNEVELFLKMGYKYGRY